jgi:protein-disulfide isomerase
MKAMANSAVLRQKARARRGKQRTQIWLIAGVTLVAVLVVGGLITLSQPDLSTVVSADYTGLAQQIDDSGAAGFAIGSPDAPVTLVEYSDFSCTHCHDLVPTIHRLIEGYVRAGTLKIVYKPISFVNPPYSGEAASAAICAADQDRFWEMHDAIWAIYEQSGPQAYGKGLLAAQANRIGLDADQFRQCYSSSETAQALQTVLDEAQVMGVQGTPSLFLNGQAVPYSGPEETYVQLKEAINTVLKEQP